jgi:hypothetical protein
MVPAPFLGNMSPYPPPMDYGRYMNSKPEPHHHYESPESHYMLQHHQRESIENPQWDNNYEKLREFYLTHGHCRVSKVTDPVLFSWCANQR